MVCEKMNYAELKLANNGGCRPVPLKTKTSRKAKVMITVHNANDAIAPNLVSSSSIENQNGKTSLVGRTSLVSKIENTSGQQLLDELEDVLKRFIVLPE